MKCLHLIKVTTPNSLSIYRHVLSILYYMLMCPPYSSIFFPLHYPVPDDRLDVTGMPYFDGDYWPSVAEDCIAQTLTRHEVE